jgi:hypothetical protein
MAQMILLKKKTDERGSLNVIESYKEIPFQIKRIFYIYDINENSSRGGHRHFKTIQALICVNGKCTVSNNDGKEKKDFVLDSPEKCLVLNPEDFHTMHDFQKGSVLVVIASEFYNPDDYIYEEYK